MKKFLLFIMGMLWIVLYAYAQSPVTIKPLSIGNTVPDIIIPNIINYSKDNIKLSDFKNKAIILDFFATWCGSCIAELPRFNSLQKQLGDELQILLVDYEEGDKVKSFLSHNSKVKSIVLPIITEDSILDRLFPHKLIPHIVWIDKYRAIKAITRPDYVNERNIRDLINGKILNLPLKKDVLVLDKSKPLLEPGNGSFNRNKLLYRSVFSRYLDGEGCMAGTYRDSSRMRLYVINQPILSLYEIAIHKLGNRIMLEVNDSSDYINDGSEKPSEWMMENSYCYEITTPISTSSNQLHKFMLQDLNRYLGLNGKMENVMVECWALINTKEDNQLLKTRGGAPVISLYNSDQSLKIIRNQPISVLINALNHQISGRPLNPIIIDETHYKGKIDMDLNVSDIQNIPSLRKALLPYGLDLVRVKRKIEMFVLTES